MRAARESGAHFFVLKMLIHLDISLKGGIFEVGKQFDARPDQRGREMLK